MPRFFLRERRNVVLELLDRELRIGRLLLLRLDHLVQFAQLRVEPRQCRALFLQPALRLAVLRLCNKVGWVRMGAQRGIHDMTHLALRHLVCERLEFLAHLIDAC